MEMKGWRERDGDGDDGNEGMEMKGWIDEHQGMERWR
jgi:hypothetical protein